MHAARGRRDLFTLLDGLTATAPEQASGASALGIAILGAIAALSTVLGALKWATEQARQRGYTKIWDDPKTATPKALPATEHAVQMGELRTLLLEAKQQAQENLERGREWRLRDAEKRLTALGDEYERTKADVLKERALNVELLRIIASQREEIARLHALVPERDSDVVEVTTAEEDDRTPTIRPPRRYP